MTTIYGIKNCDTMKKAMAWLDAHGIEYTFHDYKKHGVEPHILEEAMKTHGWDTVINRRGTTWRKLPDNVKEAMDEETALTAANDNPSLIKRPILRHADTLYVGFSEELYGQIF